MKNKKSHIKIQVYASDKVKPAFLLLQQLEPVKIHFTDWSFSLLKIIKNIRFLMKSDIIYFHSPINLRLFYMPIAKLLGKPVVLQWIGTDVLTVTWKNYNCLQDIGAEKEVSIQDVLLGGLRGITKLFVAAIIKKHNFFVSLLNFFVTQHVACAPHLVRELASVGITADYLPVINFIKAKPLPFPREFAVLSYIGYHSTSDTRDFYGWQALLRLAKDIPDLTFYILGRGVEIGETPTNIIFLGYVDDIRVVLKKAKGLIRLTYHDGMPRMVLESLATGRYVIYSKEFPCTHFAPNYATLKGSVEKLRDIDQPNTKGIKFISTEFNSHKIAHDYFIAFHKTITKAN